MVSWLYSENSNIPTGFRVIYQKYEDELSDRLNKNTKRNVRSNFSDLSMKLSIKYCLVFTLKKNK